MDKAVICYFFVIVILTFRNPSFTHALRINLYFFIDCIIPYFAFRRFAIVDNGLVIVFVFALLSQALVGATESVYGWRLYAEVEKLLGFVDPFNIYRNSREFGLRVGAALQGPSVFSLFMGLGILSMLHLASEHKKSTALVLPFFLFLGALFFSGSRSGLLACIFGAALMWCLYYQKRSYMIIFTPGKIVTLTALFAGIQGIAIKILESYDQYGTVSYRVLLLTVSSQVIMDYPFFGNANYLMDPRMEVLRQGQGIIDIVNAYIATSLEFGLVAGCLLAFILVGGITILLIKLTQLRNQPVSVGAYLVVGWLAATAAMMFTTSMRGMMDTWLWVAVGLSSKLYQHLSVQQQGDRTARASHK